MDDKHDERNRLYSRHLYNILEHIGSSEYVRRTIQHGSTVQELLLSATQNIISVGGIPSYTYKFGSSIEGTTTPGLQSDLDCLICAELPTVVEHRDDTDMIEYLLMISDINTPPGYTKLQKINNDDIRELWKPEEDDEDVDLHGNPVLKNKTLVKSMTHDEINGPAGTTLQNADYPGVPDLDYVPAFRCATWPSQANDWLTRDRPHGFPTQDMIDLFTTYGCFLVSVGHPRSQERHLQWRLSFSVQERELMFGLNPVQYRCYVLLKMVKKNFISPVTPGKSLTSYHCKTCLFYILEKLPPGTWIPENIVYCLMECLNNLLNWFRAGFIPNYFIPKENMWKGTEDSREMVVDILEALLDTTPDFLTEIQTDSIGIYLASMFEEHTTATTKESKAVDRPPICDKISDLPDNDNEKLNANGQSRKSDDDNYSDVSDLSEDDEDDEIVDALVKSLLNKGLDGTTNPSESFDLENAIQAELFATLAAGTDDTSQKVFSHFTTNYATVKAVANETFEDDTTEMPSGASRDNDTHLITVGKSSRSMRSELNETDTANKLIQNPALKEHLENTQQDLDRFIYKIHVWTLDYIIQCAKELLVFVADDNLEKCISLHRIVLRRMMLEADRRLVSEHEGLDRRMSAGYIIPFFKTSLGSQIAVQYLQTTSKTEKRVLPDEFRALLTDGTESDAMSGKLKRAAVLYRTGHVQDAKEILDCVDELLQPNILTSCGCSNHKGFVNETLRNKIRNDKLSTLEIIRGHVGVCVWFLKTEIDIIPKDLQYELFRSVISQTPRTPFVDDWFDCVAVDPDVFLFYMLHRVNQTLGHTMAMKAAQIYMLMVMETNVNLNHLDTANNILGCLLKEQGNLKAAWGCFCTSWKIRPDHNAAKWHMAIMVHQAIDSVVRRLERSDDDTVRVETIYRRK